MSNSTRAYDLPMTPRPAGRPPSFDEGDVLRATVDLLDRHGIEGCTLRAVAAELGVTPMSLYRTVESKDDLLHRLPDHLIGDIGPVLEGAVDGVDVLRRVAEALARVLDSHPRAVPLFAQPVMGANMDAASAVCLSKLEADGYDRLRAGGLLRATVALVIGLAVTGQGNDDHVLGPLAEDAVDIWLRGLEKPGRA